MSKRNVLQVVTLTLLMACSTMALAGERGYFGFTPKVSAGGFFLNPVVNSITIDSVVPGSPAAQGGIVAGDEVLSIERTQVAGSKALKLRSMAQRDVGQSLHATLRHADGIVYSVALIAVARPE